MTKAMMLCWKWDGNWGWKSGCVSVVDDVNDAVYDVSDAVHDVSTSTIHLNDSEAPKHVLPERAAILFIILAIGSIFDNKTVAGQLPTMKQAEEQTERYYELACAALGAAGVVDRGSVSCVQCLVSTYRRY
jgi:hypothetical protein